MDYDDKDFQGQNLHLAGEGSPKTSPVLQPYALPKFDFDDSLQGGHLRFDSLVENEVFLGIPNQEDNQWIEDFSRGSSGIEFSSRAAESCSISRRHNVWSEATSSESVEMLLKSVGQEEIVPEETIIEESDATDQFGSLNKKIELSLKSDDRMDDAMDSQPELQQNEFLADFSGSNGSSGTGHTDFISSPQTQNAKQYTSQSSVEMVQNADSKTCDLFIIEDNLEIVGKYKDVNQSVASTSVNEVYDVTMSEYSTVSAMQSDNTDSTVPNIVEKVGESKDQNFSHQENNFSLENENSCGEMEKQNALSKTSNVYDHILKRSTVECSSYLLDSAVAVASEVVSMDQHLRVSNFEEPSISQSKGGCELQVTEGCIENVNVRFVSQDSETEVVLDSRSTEVKKNCEVSMTEAAPVCFEGKVDISKTNSDSCASLVLDVVSPMKALHEQDDPTEEMENLFAGDHQMGKVSSDNNSGVSSLAEKESGGNGFNCVGDLKGLTVVQSSTEFLREKTEIKNLICSDSSSGDQKEYLDEENHVTPLVFSGPMEIKKDNFFSEQVDVCHHGQDTSLIEKGNTELPTNSSDFKCGTVGSHDLEKKVGLDEGIEENVMPPDGSEIPTCSANKSGSASEGQVYDHSEELLGMEGSISIENKETLKAPMEKTEEVEAPMDKKEEKEGPIEGKEEREVNVTSEANISVPNQSSDDQVTYHSKERPSSVCVEGFIPTNKKEETEVTVPSEASISVLKFSSEEVIKQGPVSEIGKCEDSTPQISYEAVDESLPMVGTSSMSNHIETEVVCEEFANHMMSNHSEPEVVDDDVGSQVTSKELEVSQSMCDSIVKDGDEAEVLVSVSHEETTVVEVLEVGSSSELVDTSNDLQASPNLVPSPECDGCIPEGSGNYQDSEKHNCSSPTVISSVEPCHSQKNKNGMDKEDLLESVPVSDASDRVDYKIESDCLNKTESDVTKEEKSFTFNVTPLASLSDEETGKAWKRFPLIQPCQTSVIMEGSPSKAGGDQKEPQRECSRGSSQVPVGLVAHSTSKSIPERKSRRQSGKSAAKDSIKGIQSKKTSVRLTEKGDKSRGVFMSPSDGQLLQFEELKVNGNIERGGTKPAGLISIPAPNLPDLNSLAPSALFQQPFTDLQQLQLRAQIFVYGSLIQGMGPDEACMVSAFGSSDGSRSFWEPAWRACVERLQSQKSNLNNPETPVKLNSGIKTPEVAKQGSVQNKVLSPPVGRTSSKGIPSPVIHPMIPLSSPLWNISTPSDALQPSGMPRGAVLDYHQAIPSLHPYHGSPLQNFVGHNASWLSQTPFPGPWAASPHTSAFDINVHFPALPKAEAVKLTPVQEPSLPTSSGAKHTSVTVVQGVGPGVLGGACTVLDKMTATVPPAQHTSGAKTRKRKKVAAAEDLGQMFSTSQIPKQCLSTSVATTPSKKVSVADGGAHISLFTQAQTESVSVPVVAASASIHVSKPVTANPVGSQSPAGKLVAALSASSSIDHFKLGDQNIDKKALLSEKTLSVVGEAKREAEDAAFHAANAVGHCQAIWSDLDKQRNSGLTSDVEAKLASAAIAISAAASVAKAAAAAAKIASNAAAQAKSMADEALILSGAGNHNQNNLSYFSDLKNIGNATPVSILNGRDGSNSSSSIIIAAREAARKRVEAASAASKHAENIEAIVKAAELAAEAVSQAGKIVAMGDPLPFDELVEAGPEGYWKVPQRTSEHGVKLSNLDESLSIKNSGEEGLNTSAKPFEEEPFNGELQTSHPDIPPLDRAISKGLRKEQIHVMNGGEKDLSGQRVRRSCDLAKTIGVDPDSEIGLRSTSNSIQDGNVVGLSKDNGIKEGCFVEVFKDGGDSKAAWFSANVLSLKDGKAFVCYTELHSDGESVQLKEWVPLQCEDNNTPRIRIAHPITLVRNEGTRKRRRAVSRDYVWRVGDRVDAWINACWREGVIVDKNEKDETTFTVHFPVEGDSSVVRTWHLRPTLVWRDLEWIEWPSSREGDTPQEKRVKVGNPAPEGKGKDKALKNLDISESGKAEESRLLPLSASERTFNVGTKSKDETRSDPLKTSRTGLQKGGSKVIFGVPTPGKKRKFMEVSKHYVADKSNKYNKANDSIKFSKYLMPQGSGSSRGWKNSTKYTKERQTIEPKPKVLRSGKSQVVSGRILPRKDNILNCSVSAPNGSTATNNTSKNSVNNDDNESSQQNSLEFGPVSNSVEVAEAPILFSSVAPSSGAPPEKAAALTARLDQMNKRKPSAAGGKLDNIEAREKSIPDEAGPRRSNRRIQPTSRLLEGLQSSLIISKIPAGSQDKNYRIQNRSSKGNKHG